MTACKRDRWIDADYKRLNYHTIASSLVFFSFRSRLGPPFVRDSRNDRGWWKSNTSSERALKSALYTQQLTRFSFTPSVQQEKGEGKVRALHIAETKKSMQPTSQRTTSEPWLKHGFLGPAGNLGNDLKNGMFDSFLFRCIKKDFHPKELTPGFRWSIK